MSNQQLHINYLKYQKDEFSDEQFIRLIREAEGRLADSYSPYSKFRVSAALLLENGEVISGANQENAAFPSCTCAEHVALSAASSVYPGIPILKLAVATSTLLTLPTAPCGNCRQLISEYENRQDGNISIALTTSDEIYIFESIADLLPFGFAKGHF